LFALDDHVNPTSTYQPWNN